VVPSLARRFGALMIDWMLCVLTAGLFTRPIAGWAMLLVLIVEYALFIGVFGQTVGMRLAKITCLDAETGYPVGILRAAIRGFLLALVIPALFMDSQRRGLHDRAAGTLVRPV
jgi:uncharacterized RDD family membrane protein YckC